MSDLWSIHDKLLLAKDILARASRDGSTRELNAAIDKAYCLLDSNLPELANAIEEMEEIDEDSP